MTAKLLHFTGDIAAERWPKFYKLAKHLHKAIIDFGASESNDPVVADDRVVEDNCELHRATAVGSQIRRTPLNGHGRVVPTGKHYPVLDLDVEHCYIPSTTEGHAHLIIKRELPWDQYLHLLKVLAQCDIIEVGYYNAAKRRGETWIRTPWTPKDYVADADEAQA